MAKTCMRDKLPMLGMDAGLHCDVRQEVCFTITRQQTSPAMDAVPGYRKNTMTCPLSKTSLSVSALLNDSPAVIGARLGQMAQAPNCPFCFVGEAVRMVLEKQAALYESAQIMWAHAAKWQLQWLTGCLNSLAKGQMPSMQPSTSALDAAASDALAPYLKRVRSNRKRLRDGAQDNSSFFF